MNKNQKIKKILIYIIVLIIVFYFGYRPYIEKRIIVSFFTGILTIAICFVAFGIIFIVSEMVLRKKLNKPISNEQFKILLKKKKAEEFEFYVDCNDICPEMNTILQKGYYNIPSLSIMFYFEIVIAIVLSIIIFVVSSIKVFSKPDELFIEQVKMKWEKEKTLDFVDEVSFENALNSGEEVAGKIVKFKIKTIYPESTFGYNLASGNHLNFCSDGDSKSQINEEKVVIIKSVYKMLGSSYIIRYSELDE